MLREYVTRYNPKHDSIVVPEFDDNNNCVAYYERNLSKAGQKATRVFSDYGYKRVPLNSHIASRTIVLVEGPFDAIAAQGHLMKMTGFTAQPISIVPLGCTALPQVVLEKISAAKTIVVACDYDWAGINGTRKVAARLIASCHDDVRIADYDLWTHHNPAQADLDSWFESVTSKALRAQTQCELKYVLSKHNARLRIP
jgi:hypothetical protein